MDNLDFLTPEFLTGTVIVIVGLIAAYFFVTPLLIMQTLKLEARPKIVPFDSEQKKPPRDIVLFYESVDRQLNAAGFEQLTGVLLPAPVPNVRVILWLYVHRANRDAAMVTAMWAMAAGAPPMKTRYVEILSEYEDGPWEQILTNTNTEVNAFREPSTHLISRMPHVKKADQLYQYHQMIVRREGLESGKVLSVLDRYDGDVTRYLQEKVLCEEYDRQVEYGVLRLSPSGKYYKPTFLGAYPMTWKQLFPVKQIILSRFERQGRKLEEELRAQG
jgi:hypothetical protein